MTTSTKTTDNGEVRKTLASQLDRLDQILDTLGEGLNEAVATAVEQAVEAAVREGVRQGVRDALSEILTDPDVLALIRGTAAAQGPGVQPAPSVPPLSSSGPGLLRRAWGLAKAGAQKAGSALGAAARRVRQVASTVWGGLRHLKPFR